MDRMKGNMSGILRRVKNEERRIIESSIKKVEGWGNGIEIREWRVEGKINVGKIEMNEMELKDWMVEMIEIMKIGKKEIEEGRNDEERKKRKKKEIIIEEGNKKIEEIEIG